MLLTKLLEPLFTSISKVCEVPLKALAVVVTLLKEKFRISRETRFLLYPNIDSMVVKFGVEKELKSSVATFEL